MIQTVFVLNLEMGVPAIRANVVRRSNERTLQLSSQFAKGFHPELSQFVFPIEKGKPKQFIS